MISARVLEQPSIAVRRQTPVMRPLGARRCPRCNGNLLASREGHGTVLHCLQCGREFTPESTAATSQAA